MVEQVIAFETAKLTKEKGFGNWSGNIKTTWYCHAKYFHKKPINYGLVNWKETDVLYISGYDNNVVNYLENTIFTYAPTQSLLQKWLREVHKIDIYILGYGFGYYAQLNNVPPGNQSDVHYIDRRWNMPPKDENTGDLNTYEKALEKGLQEALKLIK